MAQMQNKPATRYGTRYGRSNRLKVATAEMQYKNKQVCPYCQKKTVKRKSSGIYECGKCGSVFAAKAYTTQNVQVKEA
ncbi:MAG: 50S ribosomal protein L37ae [Nanoarchaeota archaeon]